MSDAVEKDEYTASNSSKREAYYDDGIVTIYLGDCREVMASLDFDAIVSDPPYGMNYRHGDRKGGRRLGMDKQSIVGDSEPFDPSHLLRDVPTVLWGGNHFADRLPPSKGWLVWDKRDGRPANDQSDVELAWTNFLTTARSFSCYWNGNTRTGREQAEGRFHVNQKPVSLMTWCLEMVPDAAVVLDPYMGSGSTLRAAKDLGRRCIGIEIDEAHCEVAVKRLAQEALDLGGVA